jgi:predicted RNA-binding Zn ribbon-like protein
VSQRGTFHLSGLPCLDLANTVSWRRSARPIERPEGYGSLVEWARQGGLLTAAEARGVERAARRRPAAAARVLARAKALREALYRIFGGLADGTAPAPADLALLDRELHEALDHLHLTRTRGGHALGWPPGPVPLARPLWNAARSATDLLTAGNVARLKTCPSASCGWVFLDTSKSGTRRWCAMWACGSRAKARRYYARGRSAGNRSGQIPHTRRAP